MPQHSLLTLDKGLARLVDWSGLQIHLLWCYEGAVSHYGRHGSDGSDEMSAWLIRKGNVAFFHKDEHTTVSSGHWLIPPSGPFLRDFSDDADIISVHFQARWPRKDNIFEDGLPAYFESRLHPDMEARATILARFVEEHFEKPDVTLLRAEASLPTYIQLQSLFHAWLRVFVDALETEGLVHSHFGRVDERVRRGLYYIDRLPLGEPFLKSRIAKQLSFSPSQMDRLFIKEIGITSNAYFEARRLNFACKALAESGAIVKSVAYDLGFRSPSHFSTWFRRFQGQSPREYMETAGTGNAALRPAVGHDDVGAGARS